MSTKIDDGTERRREPRIAVDDGLECRLEVRTRIRLLDISLSGALIAGDAELPVGTRGHLRAGVGSSPFAPEVQVKRQAERAGRPGRALGAVFMTMDDSSRRSLEEFLKKASE